MKRSVIGPRTPRPVLLLDQGGRLWTIGRVPGDPHGLIAHPGPDTSGRWRQFAADAGRHWWRRAAIPLVVDRGRPAVAVIAVPRLGRRMRRAIEDRRCHAAGQELGITAGFACLSPLPPSDNQALQDPRRRPMRLSLSLIAADDALMQVVADASAADIRLCPVAPVALPGPTVDSAAGDAAPTDMAVVAGPRWTALHVAIQTTAGHAGTIDQILYEAGHPVFASRRPLDGLSAADAAMDGGRAVRRHLRRQHQSPALDTILLSDTRPEITPWAGLSAAGRGTPEDDDQPPRHVEPPRISGMGAAPGHLALMAVAGLVDGAPLPHLRTIGDTPGRGTTAAQGLTASLGETGPRRLGMAVAALGLALAVVLPGVQAARLVDASEIASHRSLITRTMLEAATRMAGGAAPARIAAGERVAAALAGLAAMEAADPVDLICVLDQLAMLRPDGIVISGIERQPGDLMLTLTVSIADPDAASAEQRRQDFLGAIDAAAFGLVARNGPAGSAQAMAPLTRPPMELVVADSPMPDAAAPFLGKVVLIPDRQQPATTDTAGAVCRRGGPPLQSTTAAPASMPGPMSPAIASRAGRLRPGWQLRTGWRPRGGWRPGQPRGTAAPVAGMQQNTSHDAKRRRTLSLPLVLLVVAVIMVGAVDLRLALAVRDAAARAETAAALTDAAATDRTRAEAAQWRLETGRDLLARDPRPLFMPPPPGALLRALSDRAAAAGVTAIRLSLSDAPTEPVTAAGRQSGPRTLPHPPSDDLLPRLRPVVVTADLTAPSDVELRLAIAAMRTVLPGRAVPSLISIRDQPAEGATVARVALRFTTIDPASLPGWTMTTADPLAPYLAAESAIPPAAAAHRARLNDGSFRSLMLSMADHRRRLNQRDAADDDTGGDAAPPPRLVTLDGIARGRDGGWRLWLNGRRISDAAEPSPDDPVIRAVGRDHVSIAADRRGVAVALKIGQTLCIGSAGQLPLEACR